MMMPLCGMKKDESGASSVNYNCPCVLAPVERLKEVALIVSERAQICKYGTDAAPEDIQQQIHTLAPDVYIREMNEVTAQKFKDYKTPAFGSKTIWDEKTIWVDPEELKAYSSQDQEFFLHNAIEQTNLSCFDLKAGLVNETIALTTSYGAFKQAKLVKKEMQEKGMGEQKTFYKPSDFLVWKDPVVGKLRLRPGCYRAGGFAVTCAIPFLMPATPVEKHLIDHHKDQATILLSQKQGTSGIQNFQLKNLIQNPALEIPCKSPGHREMSQRDLNRIGEIVKKREEELKEQKLWKKDSHFDYPLCLKSCYSKEGDTIPSVRTTYGCVKGCGTTVMANQDYQKYKVRRMRDE